MKLANPKTLFLPLLAGAIFFLLAEDANAKVCCHGNSCGSPGCNDCQLMDSCGALGSCDANSCPLTTEGVLSAGSVVNEVSSVKMRKAETILEDRKARDARKQANVINPSQKRNSGEEPKDDIEA